MNDYLIGGFVDELEKISGAKLQVAGYALKHPIKYLRLKRLATQSVEGIKAKKYFSAWNKIKK